MSGLSNDSCTEFIREAGRVSTRNHEIPNRNGRKNVKAIDLVYGRVFHDAIVNHFLGALAQFFGRLEYEFDRPFQSLL